MTAQKATDCHTPRARRYPRGMSHQPPPQPGGRPEAWTATDRFSPEQANALAQKVEIAQSARSAYIAAHVVSDATAEQQIRQLLARILQTGRLALKQSGCRARSHKADGEGDDSYTFILDRGCRRVIKYSGPPTSWFDKEIHVPVGDLLAMLDERRRKELEAERRKEHQREAQEQRQEAHEQRMRTQRAEAEARRAAAIPAPAWPLLPAGQAYDENGQSVPLPTPGAPSGTRAPSVALAAAPTSCVTQTPSTRHFSGTLLRKSDTRRSARSSTSCCGPRPKVRWSSARSASPSPGRR